MSKTKDEMRSEYKRSDFSNLERGKFFDKLTESARRKLDTIKLETTESNSKRKSTSSNP